MEVSPIRERYVTESGMLVDWPTLTRIPWRCPWWWALEDFGSGDTLESQNFGLPVGSNCPYSVFGSPGFVRRMLDALPDGGWLGPYEKDGLEGYTSLSLFTNLNAEPSRRTGAFCRQPVPQASGF